jgi:hypothetical protein
MPYNGDVLLADAMFIGGVVPNVPVTSVVPPIACSQGNTAQLPFTCVAPLSLMPGEEVIHWVEVTMPAPGGYVAENCFGALDPALLAIAPGAPGLVGGGGAGNPSCVPVTVPPPVQPMQASPKPPVNLVKLPRCEDGRARRADGTCPCPGGTRWSEASDRCEPLRQRCSDPGRRKPDGTCCPRGTYVDNATGRCRTPEGICSDPDRRRNDGSCCPRGTFVSDNGKRCVGIETGCPPGTRWNYASYGCMPLVPVCGDGERYDWRGRQCILGKQNCPYGQRYNAMTGGCEDGGMQCPQGTHWSRSRYTCVPNDGGASCPDGSPRLATGGCRCPLNRRWSELSKSCEGSRTLPGNCLPGERHINGQCVRTGIEDNPVCPPGQNRAGKTCVPGRIEVPRDRDVICGPGQSRLGSRCVSIPDPVRVMPTRPKVTPERPRLPVKPDVPRINIKPELPAKIRPDVKIKPQISMPPANIKPPVRITPTTPKLAPKTSIDRAPMNRAPMLNKAPMNMPKLNPR